MIHIINRNTGELGKNVMRYTESQNRETVLTIMLLKFNGIVIVVSQPFAVIVASPCRATVDNSCK